MALRVAIVGGGVGGLCLAQGLRGAGVDVAVYEKDPAALARGQGYRLRLDHHGHAALRECLPEDLFALHEATANAPYMSSGAVYDHQLNLMYTHSRPDVPLDPALASRGINRLTLRQILLAGMDDAIHFGRTAASFRYDGDGVRLDFEEGGSVTVDLVVGADGINSAVRRQLLPGAGIIDTGLRAIYGQTPLDDQLLEWLPGPLFGGSSPVLGPQRRTLALGSYQPVMPPLEAAAKYAPYARMEAVPDYMKWTLVAPTHTYSLAEPQLWTASAEQLHREAQSWMSDWHPALQKLVEHADVAVTFPLAIRASSPVPYWATGRVTLLGDAAHATTPVGGTGANTALRDAALLTSVLRRVVAGEVGLLDGVRGYEASMREYGTEAVRRSLRGAEKIFRADPVRFE
jgi:2-polyprenyl-6-methoxyphenol hydroxylase-like FAD-dependent oxidoreductase